MAVKKPIVITDGELERLQPGDQIQQAVLFNRINANTGNLVIATPVYASGAGQVDKAQADALSTKDVLGLIAEAVVAPSADGAVQCDGIFAATTSQWDAVTGGSGGLTVGTKYYLDPDTAGMLTETVPSTQGDYVAMIGIALSTTEMEISIRPTVKL